MGLRFHRSLKLANLLKVNFSKSGESLSIGEHGTTINIGTKGIKNTISLPGSGLSYLQYKSYGRLKHANQNDNGAAKASSTLKIFIILLIVICVVLAITSGK